MKMREAASPRTLLGPLLHLPRCPVRKGDGKDVLRSNSFLDEPGDPPYDRQGLARTRTGHDQERAFRRGDRFLLGLVQAFKDSRM